MLESRSWSPRIPTTEGRGREGRLSAVEVVGVATLDWWVWLLGLLAVVAAFVLPRIFGFAADQVVKGCWVWLKGKVYAPLTVELPTPVNPIGRISSGGYTASWNVKVRFLSRTEKPLHVLELNVTEETLGAWLIDEVFIESTGRPVRFPISVNPSFECWIRMRSPHGVQQLPINVHKLTLRVRDSTLRAGRFRAFPLTAGLTTIDR